VFPEGGVQASVSNRFDSRLRRNETSGVREREACQASSTISCVAKVLKIIPLVRIEKPCSDNSAVTLVRSAWKPTSSANQTVSDNRMEIPAAFPHASLKKDPKKTGKGLIIKSNVKI